MKTMAQNITTRVIHTVSIDIQDDILGAIESSNDQVEVVLVSRNGGTTSAKRLTYRDLQSLLGSEGNVRHAKF
jgi:hypothetical protein